MSPIPSTSPLLPDRLQTPVDRLIRKAALGFALVSLANGFVLICLAIANQTAPIKADILLGHVVPWEYRGTTYFLTETAALLYDLVAGLMMPLIGGAVLVTLAGWYRAWRLG